MNAYSANLVAVSMLLAFPVGNKAQESPALRADTSVPLSHVRTADSTPVSHRRSISGTIGGGEAEAAGPCTGPCCPQPYSASNSCEGGTPIILDTSAIGVTVSVQVSGDSSTATNGTCSGSGRPCRTFQTNGEDCPNGETCVPSTDCVLSTQDQGHWESFTITDNADVEIAYCCSDPESPGTPGFRWLVLIDDCNVCTMIPRDNEAEPLVGCDDSQPADVFTSLPAGTYRYAVFTERYCENSTDAADCTVDDDCAVGEGPCVTQGGPYELQISARRLPIVDCCVGAYCVTDPVDALECIDMGGHVVPLDTCFPPVSSCATGACCAKGICDDNDGLGIDVVDCEFSFGQFFGGLRCDDFECPVCEIDTDANCQRDTGQFIIPNDRSRWVSPDIIQKWADDFTTASSGPLDRICWWPAFFNPDLAIECSANPPADNWELTIYDDQGGLPGNVIAPTQVIIPEAKVALGPTSRVWQYSAPVPEPPMLNADTCYWIEITGEGEGPEGCQTYWATSGDGNDYVVNTQDSVYGPEDTYTGLDGGVDLTFCINLGLYGSKGEVPGCGVVTGACCESDSVCNNDVSVTACMDAGGVPYPGQSCGEATCPRLVKRRPEMDWKAVRWLSI